MNDSGFIEGYMLGNNGSGGFGGNGFGGIWIFFLFLILAWAGNGFGGFGGYGSGGAGFQGMATRADINEGFALNNLTTGISGLRDGQFGLQNTLTQGFAGVNQTVNNLGYQMANCCCETQRLIERTSCDTMGAIKDVNYNMAMGFNNIIQNAHSDADRVLAKLSQMEATRQQERIEALTSENLALKFQASQTAQNGFIDAVGNSIVARLEPPQPVPAYRVPAPYAYNTGCYNNSCC